MAKLDPETFVFLAPTRPLVPQERIGRLEPSYIDQYLLTPPLEAIDDSVLGEFSEVVTGFDHYPVDLCRYLLPVLLSELKKGIFIDPKIRHLETGWIWCASILAHSSGSNREPFGEWREAVEEMVRKWILMRVRLSRPGERWESWLMTAGSLIHSFPTLFGAWWSDPGCNWQHSEFVSAVLLVGRHSFHERDFDMQGWQVGEVPWLDANRKYIAAKLHSHELNMLAESIDERLGSSAFLDFGRSIDQLAYFLGTTSPDRRMPNSTKSPAWDQSRCRKCFEGFGVPASDRLKGA